MKVANITLGLDFEFDPTDSTKYFIIDIQGKIAKQSKFCF